MPSVTATAERSPSKKRAATTMVKKDAAGGATKSANSSSATATKPITAKDFYAIEDEIAVALNPVSQSEDCAVKCQKLRSLLDQFALANSDQERNELKNQLAMLCITLRRMNRLSHFRNKQMREKVDTERQRVDKEHLQLQNLLHEIQHIQKETNRCRLFKSADESIELVALEEFFAKAPETIAKQELKTGRESHELMLARLTWELEERKLLSEELEELQAKKNVLEHAIASKRKKLTSATPHLRKVIEATRPLQATFGMEYEKDSCQRKMALHLPKELVYLYQQAVTYKRITSSRMEIEIGGDLDRAILVEKNTPKRKETLKAKKPNRNTSPTDDDSDASDEDEDDEEEKNAVGSSLQSATATDTNGLAAANVTDNADLKPALSVLPMAKIESSKRVDVSSSGTVGGGRRKRRPTVTEVVERHREQMMETHPLSVVFKIPCAERSKAIVTFHFYSVLEVVGVKFRLELDKTSAAVSHDFLSDVSVLEELFEDDFGKECPNPVGVQKLEHFDVNITTHLACNGFMYRWAQKLAGLDYFYNRIENMTTGAEDQIKRCDFLQMAVDRIQSRVDSRLALNGQIQNLESLKLVPPKSSLELFPTKIITRMISFKSISVEDFKVNTLNHSPVLEISGEGFCYAANFERSDAKLVAMIYVSPSYPEEAPLFLLTLKWKGVTKTPSNYTPLRKLEEGVNVKFPATIAEKHRSQMLTLQIQYVVSRLDVALEASGLLARDHLFSRACRGVDRQPPFAFYAPTNSFCFSADRH